MNEIKSLETLINERSDQEFMYKYRNELYNFSEAADILFGYGLPAQLRSILELLHKAQEEPNNPDPFSQVIYRRKMKHREQFMKNFVNSIPTV